MGIFNDVASVNAFAINAYCIVSAMFFAACAYAQLNDPNPIQWFCAYVFGGCVPNLYWMTSSGSRSRSSNSNNDSTAQTQTQTLTRALDLYRLVVGLAILYKLVTLAPKMLRDVEEFHHGWIWAFLEHEEGRDSIGLVLLLAHVSSLNAALKQQTQSQGPSHSQSLQSPRKGPSLSVASPALVSAGLLVVLGVCVYVWIVHHPDLVAKHGLKHCQGEMFGRIAGEL